MPPELLERIKADYDVVGKYLGTTLEQFEIGFMRDMHPDREVAIWCGITAAWLDYHEKYAVGQELPDHEEKKLLAALIGISTGIDDPTKLGVDELVGKRLMANWKSI